ncbi:hypothetical protein E4U13_006396 [Claviceps humidiphila]|uniref:LIM zinc-binding domain-containing protein n=1 Tax=Claviceps humidiphila TaxID=1294629 RepID=A0A9P7TUK3_9HYPO|nr:hypothetical protein E4U13_006396 [Claviceps humidiphila]
MTPRAQFEPDVFTCTFCYRLSAQKPRVLGRSARLTCAECFSVIIDLSICWACGEMVLREADTVSLGWCFWHRSCYGCLLYGSRKLCTGVLDSANTRTEANSTNQDATDEGQKRGVEMLQAPLCTLCAVECEIDSLDEHGIRQRGLKRIDVVDGGVTRRRWIEKSRQMRGEKRWPSDARDEQLGHDREDRQEKGEQQVAAAVWVNMNDPINGPSFRPYPSKPLPSHMQHGFEYVYETHEALHTCDFPMGKQDKEIPRGVERAERRQRHTEPCRS